MARRKFTEAEIIGAIRQVEAGRTCIEVAREVGVSKHTLYAWKAKYGGLTVSEAQRVRQLEKVQKSHHDVDEERGQVTPTWCVG